ncbi:MAG TPA: GGDEF domain-containing protein [Pirellulales bacterium]|jgi:diguanylate cyclase|nr:GGDEF domain-containing protein [Pirellulales bacterium]
MLNPRFEISLLVFLGVSAVQLVLGATFGWLLQLCRQQPEPVENADATLAKEALARLYELTGSLGQNVDQHASRVESIGKELALAQDRGGPELQSAILTAAAQLAEANERLQGELVSAERKLEEQAGQLQSQMVEARTDSLTGLANRRAFDTQLAQHLARFNPQETPVGLILFDIDHFKQFNDTHGHLAGDVVLRGVAQVLYRSMRNVDMVARYGGEEFAVIVPAGDALEAANAARAAVEASRFEFEGASLQVTVSGGVAEVRTGDDPETVIKRADEALYASKKAGRNRTSHHDDLASSTSALPAPRPAEPQQPEATGARAEFKRRPMPATQAEIEQQAARPKRQPSDAPAIAGSSGSSEQPEAQDLRDGLTRLPDRHALFEELDRRMAEAKRNDTGVSLVLADIDELQVLNDTHGLETGDVVLRAVTQFLSAALRSMDMIARYDGDRFALVLPGTQLDSATEIAERIRSAIGVCKLRVGESDIRFTISTGVAQAVMHDDSESLMRRSTAALHAAKAAGRNCTYLHSGQQVEAVNVAVG